ncbi:glycosyltransferase family 2 protein [Chryseobacterium turcicum]|uniref:Glycosyltransferase n=1 Tax=Chryseobacterium turcicum TaxID=2898076 RepID=A0A9Q3YYQ6_9FLAO|nr:glycosyltransferase [Chryseobacterium turcicum]MCD1118977.1 glycosyltransferase [Chryseobacterium turcicum]
MSQELKKPFISVLMPIYNGEKYLEESIDSILGQTYENFELLLINDASNDASENIILSYLDSRILYIKNEQNLGLIKTLNKGLDLAKGEFIARMDQDDIALSTRFEKQIDIFHKNPEIGVCGTWFTCFGEGIKEKTLQHPVDSEAIKINLLGRSSLGHPTVMLRKSTMENLRYDENYQSAEDYEFWVSLSRVTRLYNIPESLLKYRVHQTNISVVENSLQSQTAKKIIGDQLLYLGIENSDINIRFCETLFGGLQVFRFAAEEFIKLIIFTNQLEAANQNKKFYSEIELKNTITHRLLTIFGKIEKKKPSLIFFILKNRKEIIIQNGFLGNLKLSAKMILKK